LLIRVAADKIGGFLNSAIFPPTCPLCNGAAPCHHTLCPSCFAALPGPPEAYCLRCGGDSSQAELGCGRCLGKNGYPDQVYFPFSYQAGISKLLIGYKFADRSEWSPLLARLCWSRLEGELRWEEPEFILPIPLHFRRLLLRRYNQSALLAGELAKKLNCPMVTNGLKRIKITQPQTRLSPRRRWENVQDAFLADRKVVSGRSFLLVDDVFTTGATMASAVVELRRAGARRVSVLCVARTVDN
jgi:ComF family protein